jgi:hypothetical protein
MFRAGAGVELVYCLLLITRMGRAAASATATAWESTIEAATNQITALISEDDLATVEAGLLRLADEPALRPGSKPLFPVALPSGKKYVLKVAERALMAAEQACYELRRIGRRPCLPARVVHVEIEGMGRIEGLLKPYIEFDPAAELDADTTRWSELQRSVLLLEHAWDWFLDNLDTNTSQYALIGPDAYPLNIDWDRAFASDAHSRFSRFAKYKRTLPNARTFLYSDYVEGRITLQFELLRREARRIRHLPSGEVRRIVGEYAAVRFEGDPESARELVERVVARKRRIEKEVARFRLEMREERRRLVVSPPRDVRSRARAFGTIVWDHWQVVLNGVIRGPAGTIGRRILRLVRGVAVGVLKPPRLLPRRRPRDAAPAP